MHATMKSALLWIAATVNALLLAVIATVTAFMLSIGGTFRGESFTFGASAWLLLLVTVCVGLGVVVIGIVRAARRAAHAQ